MNSNPKKTPVRELDPEIRNKIFDEVCLGYTNEEAVMEAQRCLNCKNHPCTEGCPVSVKIPDFIAKIANGEFKDAYEIIKENNALPAICGRVCPQESQCESKCIRGIKGESVAIGRLERFAADYASENISDEPPKIIKNGKRVAVVGSGPSGLACAGDLAKAGIEVTVFEALHMPGGVLSYGIPEFRLPKKIVQKEIDSLKQFGIEFETNTVIGKTFTIEDLMEKGYDAVFIGSGAGLPSFMGIEGEGLAGVYSANEYLTRINLMKAYLDEYDTPVKKHKSIAVIGGGNVAMDAARCAKRLGAENVYIIYRRSEKELPARLEEIGHAKEEGVEFKLLSNPKKIIGDDNGKVTAIECIKMELGEPDASGRRKPIEILGSEFTVQADAVIMALGTSPNNLITSTTPDLQTDRKGCIVVTDDTSPAVTTTKKGVFAGGDAVTGAATVILAMGAGKKAAKKIIDYLNSNNG